MYLQSTIYTHVHVLCAHAEKHVVLASPTYQHFTHSWSRVTRDCLCQHVTCLEPAWLWWVTREYLTLFHFTPPTLSPSQSFRLGVEFYSLSMMNTIAILMFTQTSQYQRFPEWWHHFNGHTSHTIGGGHRNVKTNPLPLSRHTTQAQVSGLLSTPLTLNCDNDSQRRCWVCYCLCLWCVDIVSHVGSQLITEYLLITHLSD